VNQERWQQVNSLFHQALDLDAAGREALLRQTAASDPQLAGEVQSLLARHNEDSNFLEVPAWSVAADLVADDGSSRVGQQIGPYTILEELGRGGMGVVYVARDERLGRTVALKALPPEFTRNHRHRDRLAREARAAAALTHEAIATVFALEEIDGELYIASELVVGETLRTELARGPLPMDRLIPTLIDIASGLAAAHARNVVHRDLKPENLIRRTDGHVKILDFGLARIDSPEIPTVTKLTEPGTAPGTPGYMSPEQIAGADVDGRTDIFSFGVVAWELATGQHPFGSNPALILAQLMEGRPASLPQQLTNPALDAIIRRCLRVSPAERYASAGELLEDLRKLKTPTVSVTTAPVVPVETDAQWWWRFHQRIMIVVDAATPILAWVARAQMTSQYRTQLFLVVLALATASVTLRSNLLFTAKIHSTILAQQHRRLFLWIVGAEAPIAILLLGLGMTIAEGHPATAAVVIGLAMVMLISIGLIEPATTAAARINRPDSL
jgi:serine/threonine protein kinase